VCVCVCVCVCVFTKSCDIGCSTLLPAFFFFLSLVRLWYSSPALFTSLSTTTGTDTSIDDIGLGLCVRPTAGSACDDVRVCPRLAGDCERLDVSRNSGLFSCVCVCVCKHLRLCVCVCAFVHMCMYMARMVTLEPIYSVTEKCKTPRWNFDCRPDFLSKFQFES